MGKNLLMQLGYDGMLTDITEVGKHYPEYADLVKTGAEKVYFSAGKPAVLFISVPSFDSAALEKIAKVQHNAWNYQRVMLLYVTSDTEIRIYNCYERPNLHKRDHDCDTNLQSIELAECSIADDITQLASLFDRINVDCGTLWTTDTDIRRKIRRDSRVDRFLISCMAKAAKILLRKGLSQDVIHSLLIRSLFILFLEDRGAAQKAGLYESIQNGAKSYFDLLNSKAATYRLYHRLHEQFNGNITAMIADEEALVSEEHLAVIYDCFYDGDFIHDSLFERERLFNFEIIHIGLISEIYENFLGELRHKKGQFYTPYPLADMMLSEVLPTSSDEYNCPVLDPACGSGIFLVESYKRLIKRWKQAKRVEKVPYDDLVELLTGNIFGIEFDKTAIRVAAFSLYLTLIDELDPKTLWNSGNHHLPYLIYDPTDPALEGHQGNNLWCRNTITEVNVSEFPKVNLVIGNPPYGKKDLTPEIKKYCASHKFAAEYVLPFMHKASEFCPDGEIALVFSSKVLFNTGGGYKRFRKWLFNENTVRRIDNLSILRKGRASFGGSLFSGANCPVCIAYYSPKFSEDSSTVEYCSPKTFIKTSITEGLLIDDSDVKVLPMTECKKPDSKIWKIAAWGNYYSYQLINRLTKTTLSDYFRQNNWIFGRGLIADSEHQDFVPTPMISTEQISRYRTDLSSASTNTKKYRAIPDGLLDPPVVVFKQGQHKGEIACSLFTEKVFFTSTAFAMNGGNLAEKKVLAAYLNSRLAEYLLFLTTSSWGIEREEINLNEILCLPSPFEGLTDESTHAISESFDEICHLIQQPVINTIRLQELEDGIEAELERSFDLSEKDVCYITDTLDYHLGIFQKGLNARGYHRLLPVEAKNYAEVLSETLTSLLSSAKLKVKVVYFDGDIHDPLQLVSLHLNNKTTSVETGTIKAFKSSLSTIDKWLLTKQSDSVYQRKTLRYYNDDQVYIIKPNQKRFWSKMQAYDDAADIVNDILNM